MLSVLLCFTATAGAEVISFRHGVDGYEGGRDTNLREADSGVNYGSEDEVSIDSSDGGGQSQVLLAFDGIIGNGPGQIAPGSIINKATLTLQVSSAGSGMNFHRMLQGWDEMSVTWDSVVNGIQTNDVEALAAATYSVGLDNGDGNISSGPFVVSDVVADIQAWANGEANHGWAILPFPNGTNGLDFRTREYINLSMRPMLTVDYSTAVPEPSSIALVLVGGVCCGLFRRWRRK
jgi:hypothetical protein